MAPGITKKAELAILLKENLSIKTEFNEVTRGLEIKLMFDGYTEPVATDTVYLDHYHNRKDLDIA